MSLRVSNNNGYTIGYDDGINYADGRVNSNSINYQSGYNSGISYADSRVNESSTNYSTGYNNGYEEGSSKVTIDGESVKDKMELSTNLNGISVSTLPYDFYYGQAVVLNNEIHILGGNASGTRTNHYKWDGSAWASVSTLPYEFYGGSAVVLNNEIHILGGAVDGTRTNHYKWNGTKWTYAYPLPYNFYYGSAVVLNGEIYAIGLNSNGNGNFLCYKWNGSGAWSQFTNSSPGSQYNKVAVVYGNTIHVFGSVDNTTTNGPRVINNYHYKWDGSTWTSVSTAPYNAIGGSAVVLDGKIHLLGGNNQTNHYTWNGSGWGLEPSLPYNFIYSSAVVLNNEIHLLGTYANNKTAHYKLPKLLTYAEY